jgi:hypothetical protein
MIVEGNKFVPLDSSLLKLVDAFKNVGDENLDEKISQPRIFYRINYAPSANSAHEKKKYKIFPTKLENVYLLRNPIYPSFSPLLECCRKFNAASVFNSKATNSDIYFSQIKQYLLKNIFNGFNTCLLSFAEKNTPKIRNFHGNTNNINNNNNNDNNNNNNNNKENKVVKDVGIIFYFIHDLFEIINNNNNNNNNNNCRLLLCCFEIRDNSNTVFDILYSYSFNNNNKNTKKSKNEKCLIFFVIINDSINLFFINFIIKLSS